MDNPKPNETPSTLRQKSSDASVDPEDKKETHVLRSGLKAISRRLNKK